VIFLLTVWDNLQALVPRVNFEVTFRLSFKPFGRCNDTGPLSRIGLLSVFLMCPLVHAQALESDSTLASSSKEATSDVEILKNKPSLPLPEKSVPTPVPTPSSTGHSLENPLYTGFYPTWEDTGRALPSGTVYIGTNQIMVALPGGVQIGLQPIPFLYRAPNLVLKLGYGAYKGLHLSSRHSVHYILPNAAQSFQSSIFNRGYGEIDVPIFVLTNNLSGSYSIKPWWEVHGTFTALGIVSNEAIASTLSGGISIVNEFKAHDRHALAVHLIETGLWSHDAFLLGASYRLNVWYIELQVGYFYRFFKSGSESSMMFSMGGFL
jgi:hypothetical protein